MGAKNYGKMLQRLNFTKNGFLGFELKIVSAALRKIVLVDLTFFLMS